MAFLLLIVEILIGIFFVGLCIATRYHKMNSDFMSTLIVITIGLISISTILGPIVLAFVEIPNFLIFTYNYPIYGAIALIVFLTLCILFY